MNHKADLTPTQRLAMLCIVTALFFWNEDVVFLMFCSMALMTCVGDQWSW